MDANRRGFLKTAVTAAGAAAVPPHLAQAGQAAADRDQDHAQQTVLSDPALRVKALESLLVEKGLVQPAALDALIQTYEEKIGPRDGARVVARAWVDPAFKKRLLEDADKVIGELGYRGEEDAHIVVIENTPRVQNVIVCTLCSCYPWALLGLPPTWYKSAPYRSRMVMDPRGVLREFGLDLPEDVEVRVWDSTAELRYFVLPVRPQGTEKMKEAELAELVTRDSMIGVARVRAVLAAGDEKAPATKGDAQGSVPKEFGPSEDDDQ